MTLKRKLCDHISTLKEVKLPQRYECASCVESGGSWVHLRTCQSCGTTLCCDSSPNRHASRHAKEHGHHVIVSAEPGERWMWCYADKLYSKY